MVAVQFRRHKDLQTLKKFLALRGVDPSMLTGGLKFVLQRFDSAARELEYAFPQEWSAWAGDQQPLAFGVEVVTCFGRGGTAAEAARSLPSSAGTGASAASSSAAAAALGSFVMPDFGCLS